MPKRRTYRERVNREKKKITTSNERDREEIAHRMAVAEMLDEIHEMLYYRLPAGGTDV